MKLNRMNPQEEDVAAFDVYMALNQHAGEFLDLLGKRGFYPQMKRAVFDYTRTLQRGTRKYVRANLYNHFQAMSDEALYGDMEWPR